jgi:hypothetical protein
MWVLAIADDTTSFGPNAGEPIDWHHIQGGETYTTRTVMSLSAPLVQNPTMGVNKSHAYFMKPDSSSAASSLAARPTGDG